MAKQFITKTVEYTKCDFIIVKNLKKTDDINEMKLELADNYCYPIKMNVTELVKYALESEIFGNSVPIKAVNICNVSKVRKISVEDFVRFGHPMVEGDSRKNRITRTITFNCYKVVRLADDGTLAEDEYIDMSGRTEKQINKEEFDGKAIVKLISSSDNLYYMDIWAFDLWSEDDNSREAAI